MILWFAGADPAVSAVTTACPLCLGAFKPTITSQDLVTSDRAMFPRAAGGGRYALCVVEVIRVAILLRPAASFCARMFHLPTQTARWPAARRCSCCAGHEEAVLGQFFGAIKPIYANWLRRLATRPTVCRHDRWGLLGQAHAAYMPPYLESLRTPGRRSRVRRPRAAALTGATRPRCRLVATIRR